MTHRPGSSSDHGDETGSDASQRARYRSQVARIAALKRWGHANGGGGTSAARSEFLSRFEREADPDHSLSLEERAIRVARLRSAYFRTLALQSAKARRSKSNKSRSRPQPDTQHPSTPCSFQGRDPHEAL